MTLIKIIPLTLFIMSALSCDWSIRKKDETTSITDTTHLIDLVKSYEPKRFTGKVPETFYTHRGLYDWWRFPLVYPYSIHCIDTKDYGNILSDNGTTNFDEGGGKHPLTDYFDMFIFDKKCLIAQKCKSPFSADTVKIIEQYFIFSFGNGDIKDVTGKETMRKELKKRKFTGDTTFITIREYAKLL